MHYKNQSSKYENDWKGIWNVIKETIGKNKLISHISSKLIVDNKEVKDNSVFGEFNISFVDAGTNLASKIPVTNKHHSQYINAATSSLEQTEISEEEFKTAYFSPKRNKSSGYNEYRANAGTSVYNEMQKS